MVHLSRSKEENLEQTQIINDLKYKLERAQIDLEQSLKMLINLCIVMKISNRN